MISFGGLMLFLPLEPVAHGDIIGLVVDADDVSAAKDKTLSSDKSHSRARLVRVPVPITGNVERRLIAQLRTVVEQLQKSQTTKNAERLVVLEFDSSNSRTGAGSEFEDCLKLARFLISPSLNGIKTVAYLPQPLQGHALLAVMACDQVVMATDSSISGIDDSQGAKDPTIRGSYFQIANSRKTFPDKIAEGFIDPQRKLLRVETERGNLFVFAENIKELERTRTIDSSRTETVFAGGEIASLTARQARDLGVVSRLVQNRADLALLLGLSKNALRTDSAVRHSPRPRIILMDRYIDDRFTETRISMIDKAMREDGINFICLWMDNPDGDPAAVSRFAAFLSELEPTQVHTVAYIPTLARGVIPLVALACDEIVMDPEAILGGSTDSLSKEDRSDILAVVKNLIVPRKMRDKALSMALFDPEQAVYVFRNPRNGVVQYLTDSDWKKLAQPEEWRRGAKITIDGKTLQITGQQAEDFGVARGTVRDFSELKTMYGLEGDPAFAEPSWVDRLVGTLASPSLAWLLILLGLAGIYTEFQLPGIGLGGFVATVAFALYFWANFMNHTANELEIVLFLVGVSCLILEIFIIPGFGIFGLGGGILMLIALILASQTFVLPQTDGDLRQLRNSLMTVGGALVGLAIFTLISRRFLPHTPLLSRLILPTQSQMEEKDFHKGAPEILGAFGQTVTDLRPSGKAIIVDELVDVIAEGEWISADTSIKVIEVHGTRVVVKPTED
jgi:membrane-bound serine protease (ClpP class)